MEHEPELGFDLAAASLRTDEADVRRGVETLAAKLEGALPSACRVKRRRRGFLSRESRVSAIEVALGEAHYILKSSRRGPIALRVQHVHDMSSRTEMLEVAEWLRLLEAAMRQRAASNADARAALERLLDG